MGAGAGTAAWVGSAPLAVLQVGGPLGSALSSRMGARPVAMAGGALAGGGLLLAAFATHISHLCLSAGLMAGLGWALVFTPSLATLGRFFPSHRALATGVAVSGASVSGLALGPLLPFLMDTYGWRGTLLLLAAISFNLLVAAALLRPPPSPPIAPQQHPMGLLHLLRHRPFLRYSMAFVLVDLGYYLPFIHGESHAHELGCDDRAAGMLMASLMLTDGAGRLASGWLTTQWGAPLLQHLSLWCLATGVLLLLWPLGGAYGALLALALAYGLCSGALVPLQFAALGEVVGSGGVPGAIGLMQMFESGGSLLGAPLAGWLRDATGSFRCSFLVAGAFVLLGALLILTLCPTGGGGPKGGPPPAPDGPEAPQVTP